MARRRIDQAAARAVLLERRRAGLTLRRACAAAGVHIATACRWMAADDAFGDAMRAAELAAARERYAARRRRGRRVPVHPACPVCRSGVDVRRAWGIGFAFWRCYWWPACPWASWRPRHPEDCPACKGPRYWSHTRLSVSCRRCGLRWRNANL